MNGLAAVIAVLGAMFAVLAAGAAVTYVVAGPWSESPAVKTTWVAGMVVTSLVVIFVAARLACWICDRYDDTPYGGGKCLDRTRVRDRGRGLADAAELRSGGEIARRGRSGGGACRGRD